MQGNPKMVLDMTERPETTAKRHILAYHHASEVHARQIARSCVKQLRTMKGGRDLAGDRSFIPVIVKPWLKTFKVHQDHWQLVYDLIAGTLNKDLEHNRYQPRLTQAQTGTSPTSA